MIFKIFKERLTSPKISFPERFEGDIIDFWDQFFARKNKGLRGIISRPRIEVEGGRYEELIDFLFSFLVSLNLSGAERRPALPEEIRNSLQEQLNNIEKNIKNLSELSRQQNKRLPRGLVTPIREAIQNLLKLIQQPSPQVNIAQVSQGITNLLGILQGHQWKQQLEQYISELQGIQKEISEILEKSIPEELKKLSIFYTSGDFWQALIEGSKDDRLRVALGEGINEIKKHLREGGEIRITFTDQDFQALRERMERKGIRLDNEETQRLLGITQENNNYILTINPLSIFPQGIATLEKLERSLDEGDFSEESIDKRIKNLEEAREQVQKQHEKEKQEKGERNLRAEILDVYGRILQKEIEIENLWKEIRPKLLSNLSSKNPMKRDILLMLNWWLQMRKVMDEMRNSINSEIINKNLKDEGRLIKILNDLKRIEEEMESIARALRGYKEKQSPQPGSLSSLAKKIEKSSKTILGLLSGVGLVSALVVAPWLGAFAILPYGLIAWAWKQIEERMGGKK
ncbi:hypothetical protein HRbin35_00096 [bacterium HR35]|nr:hypothetical protein HRbin35_00096 [bacterium HR35]